MAIDPATGAVIPEMNPFVQTAVPPTAAPAAPPAPAPLGVHPAMQALGMSRPDWMQAMQGGGGGILDMVRGLQASNPALFGQLMDSRFASRFGLTPDNVGGMQSLTPQQGFGPMQSRLAGAVGFAAPGANGVGGAPQQPQGWANGWGGGMNRGPQRMY